VVTATLAQFGHLDILVNNAAWNIGIPFPDVDALTPEIWDRIYATNVRGPYLLARAAARSSERNRQPKTIRHWTLTSHRRSPQMRPIRMT
jgi:3-oxoacyl-[acyl-carrier protein] reductase